MQNKTLRVMSIIGAVIVGLYWLVALTYNDYDYYEVLMGWGVIVALYLTGLVVVGIVQTRHGK